MCLIFDMIKKISVLFTALSLSVVAFAQTSKSLNVGDFSTININGNIEVTIVESAESNFSFELPVGVEESLLVWENKTGVLTVKLKDPLTIGGGKKEKPSAKMTLVCPTLKEIKASGSASIISKSEISGETMELNFSTSASAGLNLDVRDLDITATQSAKITLSGKVEYLTIKANTGGYVNTITMECQNATISTATNAECYATAIKKFDAKASTNSNIFYKGKPELVKTSVNTLGAIENF